ncbi:MAG: hypothetical protein M3P18_26320 [Actinomycetota bacterium]|nr:hypothetical protein [Actinomycetota bacterium]
MSTQTLERELRRWRSEEVDKLAPDALPLTVEEALAYRNAGNLPDERGRTLRLLLVLRNRDDVRNLPAKRLQYEPDYQDAPTWRREGSKPVNVVPLRRPDISPSHERPWWEEPDVAALEEEWSATGAVGGLCIPAGYRGFVYKTILSLRGAGREVTVDAVADSLARWLPPAQTAAIRSELHMANPSAGEPSS